MKEKVSLSMSEKCKPSAGILPEVKTTGSNEWRHISTDFLGHLHLELKQSYIDLVPGEFSLGDSPSGQEN